MSVERPLSWASTEFSEDPYSALAPHRNRTLVWDESLEGWLALAQHDVTHILRHTGFLKDPGNAMDGPYTRLQRGMAGSSMMFMDDPDKARIKRLLSGAFTRGRIEAMRPQIERIASTLLDELPTASSFDLMERYAAPFSISVIAATLGIADADLERFKAWSEDLAMEYDPSLGDADRARIAESRNALVLFFAESIDERLTHPRDDLISTMVASSADGKQLSLEELVSNLVMLLVAGNVTTTDLIGNAIHALLTHPEQLALVRADWSTIPMAIEEVLRYDTPVTTTDRIAASDTEIGGCPVRKGAWVWASLAAANRDPRAHERPDAFDVTRDAEHVSFGFGPHFCLGAPLARMEAQIAVRAILQRLPDLRLDRDTEPIRRLAPAFRGFEHLVVAAR